MALDITNKSFLPSDETKWVDVPNYEGVRFLIRPAYTMDYNLAQANYDNWLQRQIAQTTDGSDCDVRVHPHDKRKLPLQAEILALHVVQDWEGVVAQGETIDFTPDNCTELLTNNPDIYGYIKAQAEEFAIELSEQAYKTRKKQ
ncbi:hypothetical protein [Marinobacter nauticus]|uniref:hypothetical protein n=1 Tax=Marinobacter nauticus TaxID=2743 RepID=UPI001C991EE5|nr:hypothetical protein [Marinobacter nauticus]MBY5962121.1 hypothetical protein [Marinobacter nauticus]